LIETTQKVSAAERKLSETENRLDTLDSSEEAIRKSLEGRRAVIAEVLAVLQRMGRKSPPALLVRPEDMLQAIRTSMLLGSILPEMRGEVEALASDLTELVRLRQSIAKERVILGQDIAKFDQERQRLTQLLAARQTALAGAEQALAAQRERAQSLAKQASNLRDLIAKMESDVARAAEDARAKGVETAAIDPKAKLVPSRDPARLTPAIAFADAKGLLPMPVAGSILKSYGMPDGFGGTEKGQSIATRRKAVVASPTDGWVAFSGPYRTYGQVLIINAGGGYYVVLAGMEQISVDVGQFVLAGEPIATMGDGTVKAAAAIAIGAAQPILYVEFRKDGASIDPGPWWAKPEFQKVRG
jgi:septal ring factor EnvC (AmiA/AmiB activator)